MKILKGEKNKNKNTTNKNTIGQRHRRTVLARIWTVKLEG